MIKYILSRAHTTADKAPTLLPCPTMSYLRPTAASTASAASPSRSLSPAGSPSSAGYPPPGGYSRPWSPPSPSTPCSRASRVRRVPGGDPPRVASSEPAGDTADDRPVVEFITALGGLPSDSWKDRTLALERLLSYVPPSETEAETVSGLIDGEGNSVAASGGGAGGYTPPDGMVPFYLSPASLRRLAVPMAELLSNPRSSVVKHACHHLMLLVERSGAVGGQQQQDGANGLPSKQRRPWTRPDRARHLLRDLIPSVLALHAQTVNVIRSHATVMMLSVISLCRFKSALPAILDALRRNKSREVREACARYIRAALDCWAGTTSVNVRTGLTGPYLNRDVLSHLGNGLARALKDPGQEVRVEARLGLETFRRRFPVVWEYVVHRDGGPLSGDPRLKQAVINAAIRADAERAMGEDGDAEDGDAEDQRSVESAGSLYSGSGFSGVSYQSGISALSKVSGISFASRSSAGTRPSRINQRTFGAPPPPSNIAKGLPLGRSHIPAPSPRKTPYFQSAYSVTEAMPPPKPAARSLPPPPSDPHRTMAPGVAADPFAGVTASPAPGTMRDHMLILDSQPTMVRCRAVTAIQAAARGAAARKSLKTSDALPSVRGSPSSVEGSLMGITAVMMAEKRRSSPTRKTISFESPSVQEEGRREPAFISKARRSKVGRRDRKSSVMLQHRFRNPGPDPELEHVGIAGALLSAHRYHIDGLMATLRVEMDVVRDFEASVQTGQIYGAAAGPSEDDVLDYFESVQMCLDERAEMGNALRKALDKISEEGA